MKGALGTVVLLALVAASPVRAADDERAGRRASPASKPSWEFGVTAYPTFVRGGGDYVSAIAVADRGPLHLEARVNYEAEGARSAFVGWTFSGGDTVTWELTPIVGGAWGTVDAFVPGIEASAAWRRFDVYIEGEYVRDTRNASDSYWYAWSELGYRPAEWLRLGIAGQRTRAYGERDIQRGPFVQLTWGHFTLGAYWFNPGSRDQVVVGLINATF